MTLPRIASALVAAIAAAALAGCGIPDPYAHEHHPTDPISARTTSAPAQPTAPATPAAPGGASTTAPATRAPAPAPTAQEALRRFALTWTNWTQHTLIAQRRAMLAMAVEPLSGQLRVDIKHATRDALERVLDASSSGRFLGVLPQRDGTFIVLTRERADDNVGTGGPGQLQYGIYLAGVEKTAAGWMVSRWEPSV